MIGTTVVSHLQKEISCRDVYIQPKGINRSTLLKTKELHNQTYNGTPYFLTKPQILILQKSYSDSRYRTEIFKVVST